MKIKSLRNSTRRGRLCFVLLVLMAIVAPIAVHAQDPITVTIGEGTSTTNTNPFGTWYNYSFAEQLYTASEIGTAGTISSISFYYSGTETKTFPLEVYMKTVDNENLSSPIAISNSDRVFNGNLSINGSAGWYTINLGTPYVYDGDGNLLIAINKGYVYYYSGAYWYYTSATNMACYAQNDNSPYTPTSSLPSTNSINTRPNIQIVITPIANPKPKSLTISDLGGRSATISWTAPAENVTSYQYQYKASEGEWTVLESTTSTSVALTGLTTDTDYAFRVKALYAEGESDFATKTFHTLITCPDPTVLQATLTQTNATIATLSWTENGEATNWVLEYGTNNDFSNASLVEVNGTPSIDLTGLTPETLYYARVKADCGDDDQSHWSSVLSFKPTTSITIPISQGVISSSYNYPVNMLYNYSLTEQIYDFDKIGYQGTINSIAFCYHPQNSAWFSISGVKLYMKHVTRTAFANNLDMEPLTEADLVWTGTFAANADGWVTITLDTPFEYDGESNLLIATLDETNGNPGGNNYFEYSNCDDYKLIQWYGDDTAPDAYNTALGWSGNKRYEQNRNNIQLIIFPSETPRPVRLATSNLFGHIATISWETLSENAIGYQYQYKTDERGEWTPLATTTNLSVSLEGLNPETSYLFRVKALYDDNGESEFSTTSFTTTVACISPMDLQATFTLGNGTIATLSWTEVGLANEWVLEYGTEANFTGATSVTVEDAPSSDLTGLSAETQYYARVKAVCGGDDGESIWSDVLEFTPTNAVPLTVYDGQSTSLSIPMIAYRFSYATKSECVMPASMLTNMDDCQINSITFYPSSVEKDSWGNSTKQVFLKEVDSPILGGQFSGTTDATIVYQGNLPTPTVCDEGYTITFTQPYTYHGGNLLIGVYNISDLGESNSIGWYGVNSSSLAGVSGWGYAGYINWVDFGGSESFLPKTTFSYIPNLMARPRNLTASNIAIHSATLSWTAANENVLSYLYRYMPEGGGWTEWTSTDALSVDLEDLIPETEYTFEVKAVYADGESNVASNTFIPTPTLYFTVYDGTDYSYNIPIGGIYYDTYVKNECIIPATQLASMNGASISAITLYAKQVSSSWGSNTYQQVFVKEVDNTTLTSFSGMEGATIVFEGQLPAPTTSLDGYTIPFSQEYPYHGGNLLIGVYNITPGTAAQSVYWYGVLGSTNGVSAWGNSSNSLESVNFGKTKMLPKTTFSYVFRNPWNLQASDITVDGATLSWNASRVDVLRYEYQYRTEDGDWTELATTDNTAVTLSDLTPVTRYTFQVRSVFEEGVYGDFVSVSFMTSQIPVLVDFSHSFADDFEGDNNWVLINGTETNQWVIGTATHLQGAKSLYISNDGQSYSYSNTNSHVFATKTFYLVPGTYEVGYTWKNKGCNQDIVNMVVVPESATFAAGVSAIEYIQSEECLIFDSHYSSSTSPSWYMRSKQFEVVEEGVYKVVFYWYNLNGYSYTTPAAIDNFYINMYLGDAPDNLAASNVTAHTANLSWRENGEAEAWQVKYYTYAECQASNYNPDDVNYGHIVDAATNTNFVLSDLDPETEYYYYVRSSYTVDGQTGYTHWSSSYGYFRTAVSCFPVTDLHVSELGTNSATLTWGTDPQQEPGNAPTEWNVAYITAPTVTYDFESESGIPVYDTDNETDWTVEENTQNAHSDSHCLVSHNSNYYAYLYIPAYGGAVASFWVKSLVEDEEVEIYVYYNYSYVGGGDEPLDKGGDNNYLGTYYATNAYQKIALDIADYPGEGTLELRVEGQIALDDITVNVPITTMTQQTVNFNQGTIGDYAEVAVGWSLENGYIISEAGYTGDEGAGVVLPIQLGGQVSFRAKTLSNESQTYTVVFFGEQVNDPIQYQLTVSSEFVVYDYDLSDYSGPGYLVFIAYDQPSLVIDDLIYDQLSMYTLTTANNNELQLTDLQQLAVYVVEVQAHCGEDDDSYWATTAFVPALCESEDQCQISYEWSTVNGDGPWSDAYLKVIHHESGLRVAMCRMENGTSGMGYFSLCDDEVYDLYLYYGGKGYVDFTIYDAAGEVIASYAQFQSLPEGEEYIQFTMDCDVCQWPTNLTATNITTQSAQLNWEQGGDVTSWLVSYRDVNALGDAVTYSNWNTLPQGWTPLTFDEDGYFVPIADWTPDAGALVSYTSSFLFIPVTMGGQAVVTARGSENEAIYIGAYQGHSLEGLNASALSEEPPVYGLADAAQSFMIDLRGYQGDGYLFLYHGCDSEPANLYLDQIVVTEPAWSEGISVTGGISSCTLEGLTAGTSYQARVQAVCGDNEYSNPAVVSFVTSFCNPESQCGIFYELHDTYGDGWNNAYIAITNNNLEVARLTLESGSSNAEGSLPLCPGAYQFVWHQGNYDSECYFTIYDPYGEVIAYKGSGTYPPAGDWLDEPYEHSCPAVVVCELSKGWNWWASTVETSMEALYDALDGYIEDVVFYDIHPIGGEIYPGEMYRILVNANCEFTINGIPATSAEIEIGEDDNWFGIIGDEPADIEDVFEDFEPVAGDKVISQNDGFAVYTVTDGVGSWVGTLTTLVPSKGYVYVSQDTETKTLYLGEQQPAPLDD